MNYETVELFEVGNAAELIQTPKGIALDEVGGNEGPERQGLEDE